MSVKINVILGRKPQRLVTTSVILGGKPQRLVTKARLNSKSIDLHNRIQHNFCGVNDLPTIVVRRLELELT